MVVTQKVQVILETILKGQEKIDAMTGGLRKMGGQFRNVSRSSVVLAERQGKAVTALANKNKILREQSERMNVTLPQVKKAMSSAGVVFNESGKAVDLTGKRIKNINKQMSRGRRESRGFQFGWLSVMFAGMALNRVFGGMIKSQLKLFGITDLFAGVLTVVMLPVMELLLPLFLKLAEFLFDLPEPIKLMIGKFIIFGAVLGIALLVIGQFMLALGGFLLLGAPILIFLALMVAAFVLWAAQFSTVDEAIDETTTKLAEFGVSPELLLAIGDRIKELAVIIGDASEPWINTGKKIMENLVKGIQEYLKENPAVVIGAIIGAWFGGPAGASIGAAIGLLFKNLDLQQMRDIIEKGFEILQGILDGLIESKDKIGEMIDFIADELGDFIGRNIGKFIELGLSIGLAIVEGIGRAVVGFLDQLGGKIKSNVRANIAAGHFPSFQSGGLVPETGLALLHKGERVIPTNRVNQGGAEITLNITNNIEVADREELERILNQNNINLVEEVKRQISI